MPRKPSTAVRASASARLAPPTILALIAILTSPAIADTPASAPADTQTQALSALRSAIREYSSLVHEISPDDLPGEMTGYAEATERLSKLGERLEMLSREAAQAEKLGDSGWTLLRRNTAEFSADLADLRGFSAPLRAYSHCRRLGIKQPAWDVTQVDAARFVDPSLRLFTGNFSSRVNLAASPGETLHFQLVAAPISGTIAHATVTLPELLSGPGRLGNLSIACFLAATRSSPVPPEDRNILICPYRLRPHAHAHNLDADFVQPYWFTLGIPADAAEGLYRGTIKFRAAKVHGLDMDLYLTIKPNVSD
jgi:hypothetical protein